MNVGSGLEPKIKTVTANSKSHLLLAKQNNARHIALHLKSFMALSRVICVAILVTILRVSIRIIYWKARTKTIKTIW